MMFGELNRISAVRCSCCTVRSGLQQALAAGWIVRVRMIEIYRMPWGQSLVLVMTVSRSRLMLVASSLTAFQTALFLRESHA
jgi:hypothetical protein